MCIRDRIRTYVEQNKPKSAAVIGGGYIGMEMAENLKHAGLDVTVVEMAEHIIAPLDSDMASLVQHYACLLYTSSFLLP